MPATTCYSEQQLSDYLLGNLSDDASNAIADHLDSCDLCEETVGRLDPIDDPLVGRLREEIDIEDFNDDTVYRRALLHAQGLVSDARRTPTPPGSPDGPELRPAAPHPEQLHEYRLLEKLGEGGMGAVYKAVHARLGRTVALKLLPAYRMKDAHALSRFEREMRAVGQIDHPGIVQGTDAGESDGTHFLVMEYVEGMDLGRLVRCLGPLPIADACEIIRQAAVALHHAHQHQLVHRDIKPSNLMLKPDGTLKVLDLGLALLEGWDDEAAELTTTGQFVGTLDYVAPEQSDDSHDVDQRADIYGLGATLYKLLCAEAPYERHGANSPLQRIKRWATLPIPPIRGRRSDIPEELSAVIEQMLAKDADDRFDNASELAEALEPFTAGCNLPELLKKAEAQPESERLLPERLPRPLAVVAPEGTAQAPARQRRTPLGRAILLALGAVLLLSGAYVVKIATDRGELVIESSDPGVEVVVKRAGKVYDELELSQGENRTSVRSGEYEVILKGETDGLRVENGVFTLTRGEEAVVKITHRSDEKPGVDMAQHAGAILRQNAPRYDGKTFAEWLNVARTERNPNMVAAAIGAIGALSDETNEREAARAILQIVARYDDEHSRRLTESKVVFKSFNSSAPVEELIEVLEDGNAIQRLFALSLLNLANVPYDSSTHSFQSFERNVQTLSERIVAAALPLIRHGERKEAVYAVSLVFRLQPEDSAVREALWQALDGDDPHLAVVAANCLVDEGDPAKLLPVLRRLALVNEPSGFQVEGYTTPAAAVRAIGRLAWRSEQATPLLVELIETGTRDARVEAIALIRELQPDAPGFDQVLWRALGGNDPRVAVFAASELSARRADADKLLTALRPLARLQENSEGKSDEVFGTAASAVSIIGQLARRSDKALALLVEMLNAPDPVRKPHSRPPKDARVAVLKALADLGARAEAAIPAVERLQSSSHVEVVAKAHETLDKITRPLREAGEQVSSEPDAIYDGRTFDDWLLIARTERKEERLVEAVEALGILHTTERDQQIASAVFDVLRAENPRSKFPLLRAAGKTLLKLDTQVLLDALLAELRSENENGRIAALLMLQPTWYDESAALPSKAETPFQSKTAEIFPDILAATEDESAQVRAFALSHAVDMMPDDRRVKSRLYEILETEKAREPLLTCLNGLNTVETDSMARGKLLIKLAEHSKALARVWVTDIFRDLSQVGEKELAQAIPAIVGLLDDKESGIKGLGENREAVAPWLSAFEPTIPGLLDMVTQRAKSGSFDDRAIAVWLLGHYGKKSPEAVAVLVDIAADEDLDAVGPPTADSVKAILKATPNSLREFAITRLGKLGPKAKSAVPVLERVKGDDDVDEGVRKAAKAALEQIKEPAINRS